MKNHIYTKHFKDEITVNDFFYVMALVLYLTYCVIITSKFDLLKEFFYGDIINPIILILLAISMFSRYMTFKNKAGILVFSTIIVIIIGKNSLANKVPIIYSFLFVIALYKKNIKFIAKSVFLTYIVLLLFSSYFSILGIIENVKVYSLEYPTQATYGLGMMNPNTFSIYYFVCISAYVYIQKRMNLKKRVFIFILSYLVYMITGTRSVFYIIILFLTIEYLFSKINFNKKKYIRNITINLFLISTMVCYFLTIGFEKNSQIINYINSILSNRILLMHKFYSIYGINLWGNLVSYKGYENGNLVNEYMILDNTYMYMLIDFGIIFTILICILYFKLLKRLMIMELNKEVAIIVTYMFFAMSERVTLLQYNFSILLFFYLINYKDRQLINND